MIYLIILCWSISICNTFSSFQLAGSECCRTCRCDTVCSAKDMGRQSVTPCTQSRPIHVHYIYLHHVDSIKGAHRITPTSQVTVGKSIRKGYYGNVSCGSLYQHSMCRDNLRRLSKSIRKWYCNRLHRAIRYINTRHVAIFCDISSAILKKVWTVKCIRNF